MFGSSTPFTIADIPSQVGRVALVTGGNTGLGKYSIIALCRAGAKVYMAARNASKNAAITEIISLVPGADVTFLELDLTSFASVSVCAKSFLSREQKLDILMNNAGVMALPYLRTAEGYEVQFGTNHMGHFLLTKLLLPVLEDGGRIVNLASIGHNAAFRGLLLPDLDTQLEKANTWERYALSKLSNILHAKELARRYPKVVAVSVHPGVVLSGLYTPFVGGNWVLKAGVKVMGLMGGKSPEQGALNQIYCAVMPVESGEYYVPVGRKGTEGWWHESPTKWAKSDDLAKSLWEWSDEEVQKHGY
ncbi:hypothetical protein BDD12DRAFT_559629 [Trichophaea hybrida]|nr:hypothetical protein BDD12DRAFT_559629 [Trichophaea hybrida]